MYAMQRMNATVRTRWAEGEGLDPVGPGVWAGREVASAPRPPWPRLVREAAARAYLEPTTGVHPEPHPERHAESQLEPHTSRSTEPLVEAASALHPDSFTPLSTDAPIDPDDELYLLGERCAEAYMEADALHYRAMTLLAEFHHREGWQDTGFSSTAEWLAWRIGIQPGAARERVRTALALEELPETSEAMRRGELSYTKVRALTRVARPETESTLLEFAQACSAAKLEQVVRGWKTLDRKSEVTAEQIRHRSRRFSAFVDVDGMVVVRGRLDPEVGALLMRAVEAAGDALYREERRERGDDRGEGHARKEGNGREEGHAWKEGNGREERHAQTDGNARKEGHVRKEGNAREEGHVRKEGNGREERHAQTDGNARKESHAQADGDPGHRRPRGDQRPGGDRRPTGHRRPSEAEAEAGAELGTTTPEQRRADAVGLIAERALAAGFGGGDAPISGSRAERYQVMLHVDSGTLTEDGEPGLSELEDGTRVSAETSRRIACDAGVVQISRSPDGQILGAGRRNRTIPPSLRRALEARDRGCRFPGCGLRFTEAHHVLHWADGGETTLRNTTLLCHRHHRAVHEGGVRVCIDARSQVVFFTPKGKAFCGVPPQAEGPERPPSSAGRSPRPGVLQESARGWSTGWERKPSAPAQHPRTLPYNSDRDIPWALEAKALEALDSG